MSSTPINSLDTPIDPISVELELKAAKQQIEVLELEVSRLTHSLESYQKAQEEDDYIAERWIAMSDELMQVKESLRNGQEKNAVLEKDVLSFKTALQKMKDESKSLREHFQTESAQLSAHRNNSEKLANKVAELSQLNEGLKRTNGALEARIKYLETQFNKNCHAHKLFKPADKSEQDSEQLPHPAFP